MAEAVHGRIVQVIGPVVDIQFPPGQLPEIYDAVEIPRNGEGKLVLEVQQHLGGDWVRCLAMDSTDGLQRGMEAVGTGAPIMVPVGEATLGRLLNVLGEPIDRRGPVETEERRPIHQAPPSFEEQSTSTEVFETGLKVIDLVAPFCECNMVPDDTVIPRGGPLGFQASVTNNTDLTGCVYFATKVRIPVSTATMKLGRPIINASSEWGAAV